MRKTLLLVFIHGFKGGDDTFGTFPEHVKALISHALPNIDVVAIQYPQFETRGELKECVSRFREWLENKVIDLEVANGTPSPTIDPSVHTILVGHSMGGIVAAEALLLLASEQPIPPSSSVSNPERPNFPSNTTLGSGTSTSRPNPPQNTIDSTPTFMFPHIQGILAFDTPYLGLAPEMVAHSLEGGHKAVSSAWDTANEVASVFGWGSKANNAAAGGGPAMSKSVGALPAPPVAASDAAADAAAAPRWQSWGKYAMFAGAAGAVAAGGAVALYSQRDRISAGWTWATSHLLFVGDLAKAEILRQRVEKMEKVVSERGLGGCANFYTNLGRGAREGYGITESVAGRERTFCNLPKAVKDASNTGNNTISVDGKADRGKLRWTKAINDKAKDETAAHMSMFFPRENPGFYALGEKTVEIVTGFLDDGWYESSTGPDPVSGHGNDNNKNNDNDKSNTNINTNDETTTFKVGSLGKDWDGLNDKDVNGLDSDEDVEMRDEDKENQDMLEDSVIIENNKTSSAGSGYLRTGANEAEKAN